METWISASSASELPPSHQSTGELSILSTVMPYKIASEQPMMIFVLLDVLIPGCRVNLFIGYYSRNAKCAPNVACLSLQHPHRSPRIMTITILAPYGKPVTHTHIVRFSLLNHYDTSLTSCHKVQPRHSHCA